MYEAFFGLRLQPFNVNPDPRFLFLTRHSQEALACLTYGMQARKGFVLLTGEVGTGKTTMLECLRDFLDDNGIEFAFIFNSRINSDQFFEMIAYDLGLECQRTSKPEVLFALNALAVRQADQGRTTAIIIDEAHNLEWEVLEEIRLLGNMENREGKLIQVVLAGQPELDRKLDSPNLRQLKQRVVLHCMLEPFGASNTTEYINARLEKAGLPGQTVFPSELISEIHARSQGIPRLINAICDNLLLTCFAMDTKVATLEILDEVSADMRLEWPGHRPSARHSDTLQATPFYTRRAAE